MVTAQVALVSSHLLVHLLQLLGFTLGDVQPHAQIVVVVY